jgi:predicted acyl esterase
VEVTTRLKGIVVALALAVSAGGLGAVDAHAAPAPTPGPPAATTTAAGTGSGTPAWSVRGSVHQLDVIGAPPHTEVTLRRGWGTIGRGQTDDLGGYVFRNLPAGGDYRVALRGSRGPERSVPVRVLDARATPPATRYSGQRLEVDNLSPTSGYGYLTTRDGTTLSVQVVLPGPPENGPYPTVMEYSGYDPSSPTTGQPQYKLLMPALGYAWVGVNIRATGCSGGAFNFFENLQALDGYDAIETIAAQPWSTGRVGMVGISYAGISQLFVARTRPPHLAAITPVSVIDDTWRGTLFPGGIFNDGFALGWATERVEQNKWPNPNAPKWVTTRIAEGDTTCADNMRLRGQNVDLLAFIKANPYYRDRVPEFRYDFPAGGSSLTPADFVGSIKAPTLVAGAWQDEQTGGHWANMLNRFAPGTKLRAVGQNGVHTSALDPAVLLETLEFLDLYVAQRVPRVPPLVRALVPAIWSSLTGVSGLTLPPDRFSDVTDHRSALSRFEAEPPIRILWENGNAPGLPAGAPGAAAETRYSAWPVPEARPKVWYLDAGGQLTRTRPTTFARPDTFRPDPARRPRTSFTSGNIWGPTPAYDWRPAVDGASLTYSSAPLTAPTAMVGTGSIDLWVRSRATDGDVQVTLSEVTAGGTERYVQNGWLRLSHRAVDRTRSTVLAPFHTDLQTDAAPLPAGRWVSARVGLFPFAHQFRAGSRIRITIQAPGGDRPEWTFATPATAGAVPYDVAHDVIRASRVVLPVLAAGQPTLPASAAPCPSLRAQPCRNPAPSSP